MTIADADFVALQRVDWSAMVAAEGWRSVGRWSARGTFHPSSGQPFGTWAVGRLVADVPAAVMVRIALSAAGHPTEMAVGHDLWAVLSDI